VVDARRYARFKLEVDVTLRSKRLGAIPGFSTDISESGMSVTLPVELRIGEDVELHINLPIRSVDVKAFVRNRNAFRHGFEFADNELARQLIAGYFALKFKGFCLWLVVVAFTLLTVVSALTARHELV
jgi:hypothetical protein